MLFKHPSTLLVIGPSQSGKSSLVRKIIKQNIYDRKIKTIKWCYSVFQPWFLDEPDITFENGIPDDYKNTDLVIFDDLIFHLQKDVAKLFTIDSHHNNVSCILILQNLFPKSKFMRDISLNTHYMILFKNNRDTSQLACLARQAFPSNVRFFMDAYKIATDKKYGYLVCDFHPLTDSLYRLRDSCFPDENNFYYVFVPK